MVWKMDNFNLNIIILLFTEKLFFVTLEQNGIETRHNSAEKSSYSTSGCTQIMMDNGNLLINCSQCSLDKLDTLSNFHIPVILDLSNNHMETLEVLDNLDSPLSIVKLILRHNEITHFDKIPELSDLENLNEIDLSYNKLSELTGEMMRKTLPKLKILNLRGNKINKTSVKMLKNLDTLKSIDLSFNSLTEWNFQTEGLLNFSCDLESLDMSNNKVTELTDSSFTFANGLTKLNISNNFLIKIYEKAFEGLINLKVLDLSHNKLVMLPAKVFSKLNRLSYLYLAENQLLAIPVNVPILNWFDLSFNKITEVDEMLNHVIYPHEVILLGGNPFLCDCNLLWLKEFYDTREYLLKFIDVDKDKFIPVCEFPDFLKGETWDNIGDDVFECNEDAENQDIIQKRHHKYHNADHSPQFDDKNVNDDPDKDEYIIDFRATDIKPESVRVEWTVSSANFVMLSYRTFGDKKRKQAAVLPAAVTSFVLRKLDANKPYIICIALTDGVNSSESEKQKCIEIMTVDNSRDKNNDITALLSQMKGKIFENNLVIFVSFSCVLLFIYVMFMYFHRSITKKQKQS